ASAASSPRARRSNRSSPGSAKTSVPANRRSRGGVPDTHAVVRDGEGVDVGREIARFDAGTRVAIRLLAMQCQFAFCVFIALLPLGCGPSKDLHALARNDAGTEASD